MFQQCHRQIPNSNLNLQYISPQHCFPLPTTLIADNQTNCPNLPQHHLLKIPIISLSAAILSFAWARKKISVGFGCANSISRRPGKNPGEKVGKVQRNPAVVDARARYSRWIARESCETWKCDVISLSGSYVSRVHADCRYKRNPSCYEIEIEFDNVGCGFDWLISISSSFL